MIIFYVGPSIPRTLLPYTPWLITSSRNDSSSSLYHTLGSYRYNCYGNTHVRKWGWFFTVSSSFSKNVVSVASPGLRHSSSYKHTHSSIDFLLRSSAHRAALVLSHWNTAPVWPCGLLTGRPALSSTKEELLSWKGKHVPPSGLPGLEVSFLRAEGGDTIRPFMASLFSLS